MLYIVTADSLPKISEKLTAKDKIIFLYQKDQSMMVEDLAPLLRTHADVSTEGYDGHDDMLIALGGIMASAPSFTMLDDSIPVPRRYESKAAKTQRGRRADTPKASRTRKPRAKTEDTKKDTDTESKSLPSTDSGDSSKAPEKKTDTVPPKIDLTKKADAKVPAEKVVDSGEKEMPLNAPEKSREYRADFPEKMAALLNFRAEDIGYPGTTSRMMSDIIFAVQCAEDNASVEREIKTLTKGNLIWRRIMPKIDQVRQVAAAAD